VLLTIHLHNFSGILLPRIPTCSLRW